MDIKITHSLLKQFLDTKVSAQKIADSLSLCGPTIGGLTNLKDDYVYDIEIITNRVDTASAFGIAREAVAILPQFNLKAKLANNPFLSLRKLQDSLVGQKLARAENLISVDIKDDSLVPRFAAVVFDNIKVQESPEQVKQLLTLTGQRPLNNIIDITNELALKYGQPCHAFDFDKITGHKLILRQSQPGENITTLDGKAHSLRGNDIVVEDGAGRLIDLCGIMGGDLSKIDQNTKRVLLFVQTYEPKHIRRTSLYTQQRTIAAQIFEKGPDPEMVLPVLAEGIKLVIDRAGGQIASTILDLYPHPFKPKKLELDISWLSHFAGIKISRAEAQRILNNLGFTTKNGGKDKIICTVPSFRDQDINFKQDLAEEVLRIYGYFRLPSRLPVTDIPKTETDPLLKNEYDIRQFLAHVGFTEVYNSSLISQALFEKTNLPIGHSVRLKNPLSSDQEYMRRSLIPSNLQVLESNRGKVELPIRVFELSHIYLAADNDKDLPEERPILTLTLQGDDYHTAKGYLETLFNHLNIQNPHFYPMTESSNLFSGNKSANIYQAKDYLGLIGEINAEVKNNFQLDPSVPIIVANLDFQVLSRLRDPVHHFNPVPSTAILVEDITLNSPQPVGDIINAIKKVSPLISQVAYQTSFGSKHSFHLHFNHPQRNLTQKEVNQIKTELLKI